jgi:hypothetical protein
MQVDSCNICNDMRRNQYSYNLQADYGHTMLSVGRLWSHHAIRWQIMVTACYPLADYGHSMLSVGRLRSQHAIRWQIMVTVCYPLADYGHSMLSVVLCIKNSLIIPEIKCGSQLLLGLNVVILFIYQLLICFKITYHAELKEGVTVLPNYNKWKVINPLFI